MAKDKELRVTTENPTTLHVLYYALKDLNNVEIATQIGITEGTVRYHKKKLNWQDQEVELYKANRAKLQQLIQSRITGLQLEFLSDNKSKIEGWSDYKSASVSKAVEVDKEVVVINQFGTTTVNIDLVSDKIEVLKKRLADKGIDSNTIDVTPSEPSKD